QSAHARAHTDQDHPLAGRLQRAGADRAVGRPHRAPVGRLRDAEKRQGDQAHAEGSEPGAGEITLPSARGETARTTAGEGGAADLSTANYAPATPPRQTLPARRERHWSNQKKQKWNSIIDVAECTNCNLCTLAAMDEYVDNDWPGYAAPMPKHGHKWINI